MSNLNVYLVPDPKSTSAQVCSSIIGVNFVSSLHVSGTNSACSVIWSFLSRP